MARFLIIVSFILLLHNIASTTEPEPIPSPSVTSSTTERLLTTIQSNYPQPLTTPETTFPQPLTIPAPTVPNSSPEHLLTTIQSNYPQPSTTPETSVPNSSPEHLLTTIQSNYPQPSTTPEPTPERLLTTIQSNYPEPSTTPERLLTTIESNYPQPFSTPSPQPLTIPAPSVPVGSVVETVTQGEIVETFTISQNVSLFITSTGELFRTVDGGITWNNESSKMNKFYVHNSPKLQNAASDVGVYQFYVSPANPQQLYIIGFAGNTWVSSNGGETYTFINAKATYSTTLVGLEFAFMKPHPVVQNWVAASVYSQCCWEDCPLFATCTYDLVISLDGAVTWTAVVSGLVDFDQYDWGSAGKPGYSNGTFFFLFYRNMLSTMAWTKNIDSMANANFYALAYFVLGFEYDRAGNQLFISLAEDNDMSVYVSTNQGRSYTHVEFPVFDSDSPSGGIEDAMFLDSEENIVGVVQNGAENVDLYIMDLVLGNFAVSLNDVTSADFSDYGEEGVDFFELTSFPGIYVANHLIKGGKQTVITFNAGGKWGTLSPPSDENCNLCTLNLFGASSLTYNLAEGTFGSILANGNVGLTLKDVSQANLYLSLDAGITWSRIRNGAQLFDVDVDNIISVVNPVNSTKEIFYSLDSGISWKSRVFSNSSARTHRAVYINAKLGSARNFVWIQTKFNDSDGKTGYSLFSINLAENRTICTEDDYEDFSLGCFLGSEKSFRIVESSSACLGDAPVESDGQNCNCTRDDFYCRYCYTADPITERCVEDTSDSTCGDYLNSLKGGCTPGANFTTASPYRKLKLSNCTNIPTEFSVSIVWDCPNFTVPIVTPTPYTTGDNFPITTTERTTSIILTPTPVDDIDKTAAPPSYSHVWISLGVVLGVVIIGFITFYAVIRYRRRKLKRFDEMGMETFNSPRE